MVSMLYYNLLNILENTIREEKRKERESTFIIIYVREDPCLFVKLRELLFGQNVGCNHLSGVVTVSLM